MSSPAVIAWYIEGGAPPAYVEERLWEGVYNHSSSEPEYLGNALLECIRTLDGDLHQFVALVRRATGWRSFELGERLEHPPEWLLRSDAGGADSGLYCYVLDIERRRLDVFATASGQCGQRLTSVVIALDGTSTPAAFEPGLLPDADEAVSAPSPWLNAFEQALSRLVAAERLDRARLTRALADAAGAVSSAWMTAQQLVIGGISTEGMRFHPNSLRLTPLSPFLRAADAAGIPRRSMQRVLEAALLACVEQAGFSGRARVRLGPKVELVGDGPMPVSVDWGKALLDWLDLQQLPKAEPAPPPPIEKTHPKLSAEVVRAIDAICHRHSLTPSTLAEGIGELLEESLLMADWEGATDDDEAPEIWPTEWNPVLCLSDDSVTAPHRLLQLNRLSLWYPRDWRGLDHTQATVELRRGDGRYVTVRLTPEMLAKAGPRRLGDTRAVLRETYSALGEARWGVRMRLDANGVAWLEIPATGPEGLPLLLNERQPGWTKSNWHAWCWPLFDWLSSHPYI